MHFFCHCRPDRRRPRPQRPCTRRLFSGDTAPCRGHNLFSVQRLFFFGGVVVLFLVTLGTCFSHPVHFLQHIMRQMPKFRWLTNRSHVSTVFHVDGGHKTAPLWSVLVFLFFFVVAVICIGCCFSPITVCFSSGAFLFPPHLRVFIRCLSTIKFTVILH